MRTPEVIYVEKRASQCTGTRQALHSFSDAQIVEIEHYASLFHRRRQSFRMQKERPALMIAASDGPFLYRSPDRVGGDGTRMFYTDQVRNCLFDCDYCFLQGMHPSAHPVLFVNESDYHEAVEHELASGPMHINTSFLSDALSVEAIVPTVEGWIRFAREHPDVTVEVRTKSAEVKPFLAHDPLPNVRAVWTLSPTEIARRYERGCAPLDARLDALSTLANAGWEPGVAIDPVILIPGWHSHYAALLAEIPRFDPRTLSGVSFGVFRMASGHLDTIRGGRRDSAVLFHPFERHNGLATYKADEIAEVQRVIGEPLVELFGEDRVTFVHA